VRAKDLDRLRQVGLGAFVSEMLAFPVDTPAEQSAFNELVNRNAQGVVTDPANLVGGFPTPTMSARWWERLMMETDAPFQETLAFFWHDHFGVSASVLSTSNYYYVVDHVNLLRRRGNGNLRTLLLDVSRDPAMLVFLNGVENTRRAPNENFAREFWEIYTLGADNGYAQADITTAARAWTGYRERQDPAVAPAVRNIVAFDTNRQDRTAITVFGQTIPAKAAGDASDNYAAVVDITLANRPVAEFVSRKLFEYFVYLDPPQTLVDDMAAYLRSQDYEIAPFVDRLLRCEAFWSAEARSGLVKSPLEFTVGFLRSTGLLVTPANLDASLNSLTQRPCLPPTVAGWPSGDLWVFSAGMLDRINFVDLCIEDRVRQASVGINVANILPPVPQRTADAVVDTLSALLRIELTAAERTRMVDYLNTTAGAGGTAVASPFDGSSQAQLDERVRGLLYVLAQHPTYQSR
jgi:uncharacterized protein (DUF1800 family)